MEQDHNIWSIESPKGLGTALRALREQAGFTQQELADALGTTRHRLSRIEDGHPSGQLLLLLRALRFLGVTVRLDRTDA